MSTATYDRSGLNFLYPENWKLVEDSMDAIPRTIVIQSPTGAFWSVDIHPFSVSREELIETVAQAMKEEYPELESYPVSVEILDNEAVGFDLFFCCLDFVVTSHIRALQVGHATYLLTYQAEDRDFEKLGPVFDAMTLSLLKSTDD